MVTARKKPIVIKQKNMTKKSEHTDKDTKTLKKTAG